MSYKDGQLDIDAVRKNPDNQDFKYISGHYPLPESFIREFADRLDWDEICHRQLLSESLMRAYIDKLNLGFVCAFQILSEEFLDELAEMDKNEHKLDWYSISSSQTLSESFIVKYQSYVEWGRITMCQKLSPEFVEQRQIRIPDYSWSNKDNDFKINFLKTNTKFEVIGSKVIGYVRRDKTGYDYWDFKNNYYKGSVLNGPTVYSPNVMVLNPLHALDYETAFLNLGDNEIICKIEVDIDNLTSMRNNNFFYFNKGTVVELLTEYNPSSWLKDGLDEKIELFNKSWEKIKQLKTISDKIRDCQTQPLREVCVFPQSSLRYIPGTSDRDHRFDAFRQEYVIGSSLFLIGFSILLDKSIVPDYDWECINNSNVVGFDFDVELPYKKEHIKDIEIVVHYPNCGLDYFVLDEKDLNDGLYILITRTHEDYREQLKQELIDIGLYVPKEEHVKE
jgi:hypothetical protein